LAGRTVTGLREEERRGRTKGGRGEIGQFPNSYTTKTAGKKKGSKGIMGR